MAELYKTRDLSTGQDQLKEAQVTSAGSADAGKIPALDPSGKLHPTLLPAGVGAETRVVPASENLGAGQFVNLWVDSGQTKARLADADNGRPADGFVSEAVTSSANATVFPLGTINSNLSGLTNGETYFLSDVAGGVTDDISGLGDGDIVQRLGKAHSATEMLTEWNEPEVIVFT